MKVTGEGEPSTMQDRFSYLVLSINSIGAKVTSKGTSMPGQMYPLAGVMDNSGGKVFVFHWNLDKSQKDKEKANNTT